MWKTASAGARMIKGDGFMQHADIEFVRFGASDVIATSGGPHMWGFSSSLADLLMVQLDDAVGDFPAGSYSVVLNGTVPSIQQTLYRFDRDYVLRPVGPNYTLFLFGEPVTAEELNAARNADTDLFVPGNPGVALPMILEWLGIYGRVMVQQ